MTVLVLTCITPTGDYSLPKSYTSPTPSGVAGGGAKSSMSRKEMIGAGVGVGFAALLVSTGAGLWIIRARHI